MPRCSAASGAPAAWPCRWPCRIRLPNSTTSSATRGRASSLADPQRRRRRSMPLATAAARAIPDGRRCAAPRSPADGLPHLGVEPARDDHLHERHDRTAERRRSPRTQTIGAQIASLVEAWGWTPADRLLLVLPLHHVHGIINGLGSALAVRATCEILPAFDAETRLGSPGVGRDHRLHGRADDLPPADRVVGRRAAGDAAQRDRRACGGCG